MLIIVPEKLLDTYGLLMILTGLLFRARRAVCWEYKDHVERKRKRNEFPR